MKKFLVVLSWYGQRKNEVRVVKGNDAREAFEQVFRPNDIVIGSHHPLLYNLHHVSAVEITKEVKEELKKAVR